MLSVSLTHTLAPTAPTLYRSQDTIDHTSTAPLLVRQHIAANFLLARLHEVDVGEHALVLEGAGELAGDGRSRVEAGERDELKDESACDSQ